MLIKAAPSWETLRLAARLRSPAPAGRGGAGCEARRVGSGDRARRAGAPCATAPLLLLLVLWAQLGASSRHGAALAARTLLADKLPPAGAAPSPSPPPAAARACAPDAPPPAAAAPGATASADAADASQLRAALLDPSVGRVRLAGAARLAPQSAPGGAWGGGAGARAAAAPASAAGPGPLFLSRPVEIVACPPAGEEDVLFDMADGAGDIVVVPGASLRLAGPLRVRPCAGGGGACAGAWPAVPAVALAPGARLELEGVTVEGSTPTTWGAAASGGALPLQGADVSWEAAGGGGGGVLLVRRLSLSASQMWGSLQAAGGARRRRRRLLAAAGDAAGGGGGGGEASYHFTHVRVIFAGAAATAAAPPAGASAGGGGGGGGGSGLMAAAIAGWCVGGAALLLLAAAGAAYAHRAARARRRGGGGAAKQGHTGDPSAGRHAGGSPGGGGAAAEKGPAACPLCGAPRPAGGGGGSLCAACGLQDAQEGSFLVARVRSDPWGAAAAPGGGGQLLLLPPPAGAHAAPAAPAPSDAAAAARGTGGAGSSAWGQGGGDLGLQRQAQRQQFESAARAVQALHLDGTASRGAQDDLVLESVLGEGTFGMVYRAWWKGSLVAVKRMLFPAGMSGQLKREKMAIMETAISARLRHPNIVQLYAFYLRPLASAPDAKDRMAHPDDDDSFASLGGSSREHLAQAFLSGDDDAARYTWEVKLVLEYCDRGSLRSLLSSPGAFAQPDGSRDMLAVVSCALDVAQAMLHLHSTNVVHSDLKARNVLLKTAASVDDSRGFVAKVADFGLSLQLPDGASHVSGTFQGTMTHMAPEVMMSGRISKASDVYAFGILMWELLTGQHAFKGVPRALLGHEVAYQQLRPQFPDGAPFDYALLACRCWESDFTIRPAFESILEQLQRMRARLLAAAGREAANSSGAMPGSSSLPSAALAPPAAGAPAPAAQPEPRPPGGAGGGSAGGAAGAGGAGGAGGGGGGILRLESGEHVLMRTLSRLADSSTTSSGGGGNLAQPPAPRSRGSASGGPGESKSYYISQPDSTEDDWGLMGGRNTTTTDELEDEEEEGDEEEGEGGVWEGAGAGGGGAAAAAAAAGAWVEGGGGAAAAAAAAVAAVAAVAAEPPAPAPAPALARAAALLWSGEQTGAPSPPRRRTPQEVVAQWRRQVARRRGLWHGAAEEHPPPQQQQQQQGGPGPPHEPPGAAGALSAPAALLPGTPGAAAPAGSFRGSGGAGCSSISEAPARRHSDSAAAPLPPAVVIPMQPAAPPPPPPAAPPVMSPLELIASGRQLSVSPPVSGSGFAGASDARRSAGAALPRRAPSRGPSREALGGLPPAPGSPSPASRRRPSRGEPGAAAAAGGVRIVPLYGGGGAAAALADPAALALAAAAAAAGRSASPRGAGFDAVISGGAAGGELARGLERIARAAANQPAVVASGSLFPLLSAAALAQQQEPPPGGGGGAGSPRRAGP